ncbi:hypothetical protein BD560DRAFT_429757 [Blakeslea trispora]|nr:hypothetical protein BD560DRAFT_429757 [Blakeslea trispora]
MYQTAQQIADSLHEPGSNMELVPFGSDSSLHREDIWELFEKRRRSYGRSTRTGDEEHLRAGIIEYFFLHETDYHENGEIFSTKHCFAFVSWYKNLRIDIDDVETGTTERIRPFRKEYERKSFRSILPVHNCMCSYIFVIVISNIYSLPIR